VRCQNPLCGPEPLTFACDNFHYYWICPNCGWFWTINANYHLAFIEAYRAAKGVVDDEEEGEAPA
jgi:hypothetical protein